MMLYDHDRLTSDSAIDWCDSAIWYDRLISNDAIWWR